MNSKEKNPSFTHIPKSKFTYPDSCYSFIVRLNEIESVAEIYFPPEVAIADDFDAWLTKHKFCLNENNPQLYTSRLCAYGKRKIVEGLLERAKDNGAYQIDQKAKIEEIGNRSEVTQAKPKDDLATTVAEKINALVAQKLESIINSNQKAIAEYEEKIADLNEQLAAKDTQIEELKQINSRQTQKLSNLKEYERLLGITKQPRSPFDFTPVASIEPSDITHLNSPFKGGDLEILDPDDYDEAEYNENIAPAKLDRDESYEISLNDINLELNEENSKLSLEPSKDIDLNKILAEISSENSNSSPSNGLAKKL